MSQSNNRSAAQNQLDDNDPVEKIRRETEVAREPLSNEVDPAIDLFAEDEGRRLDGSHGLPKITMATIRAFPERCKQAEGGRLKIAAFTGIATRVIEVVDIDQRVWYALGSSADGFAAVRYDNRGQPDALFKSDLLYFPIGHQRAVDLVAKTGYLSFSLEFWAQTTTSKGAGYSWSYINLAKLDRNNLSPIDRLIQLTIAAGRRIGEDAPALLADLRTPQTAK